MDTIYHAPSRVIILLSAFLLVTPLSQALAAEASRNSESDSICPEHPRKRTPQQVLEDHVAAFVSGDAALVACDYAPDAVFIQPAAVAHGKRQIQATFAFFFGIAGGNIKVSTKSLTFAANTALFEYAVDSNNALITDGVDTFVVRHGLIVVHTAHLGGLAFK
jgi:ketosteroid isomerase-like protein